MTNSGSPNSTGCTVLDQDGLDRAGAVRLDLVQKLHGLDDTQRIACLDGTLDSRRKARFSGLAAR